MPEIHFFSEHPDFQFEQTDLWSSWLSESAAAEGFVLAQLNLIAFTDEELLKMNQEYLDHDDLTDVITFPYSIGKEIQGEIYLSADRAKENALKLGVTLIEELHRLSIHGLLHLCGYGDKSPGDKAVMTSKEDYYLNLRPF
jgi:probable rRNA maturation factor